METFSEKHKLLLPFLKEMSGPGHFRFARVLADAGKVQLFFLHVVAQSNVVKVGGDVDQSVGHHRVSVLRQHIIHKEFEPEKGRGRKNNAVR